MTLLEPAKRDLSRESTSIRYAIRLSGGLINNPSQARICLLLFFVISLLFSFFLVHSSATTVPEPPSQELIDTPQPEEGYVPLS